MERNDIKTRKSTCTNINENIVRSDLNVVYGYYVGFLEEYLTSFVEISLPDFHKINFVVTKAGPPTLALSFPVVRKFFKHILI